MTARLKTTVGTDVQAQDGLWTLLKPWMVWTEGCGLVLPTQPHQEMKTLRGQGRSVG